MGQPVSSDSTTDPEEAEKRAAWERLTPAEREEAYASIMAPEDVAIMEFEQTVGMALKLHPQGEAFYNEIVRRNIELCAMAVQIAVLQCRNPEFAEYVKTWRAEGIEAARIAQAAGQVLRQPTEPSERFRN